MLLTLNTLNNKKHIGTTGGSKSANLPMLQMKLILNVTDSFAPGEHDLKIIDLLMKKKEKPEQATVFDM